MNDNTCQKSGLNRSECWCNTCWCDAQEARGKVNSVCEKCGDWILDGCLCTKEEEKVWKVLACPPDVQPFTVIDLQPSRWSALKELARLCKRLGHSKRECKHWLRSEQLILVQV